MLKEILCHKSEDGNYHFHCGYDVLNILKTFDEKWSKKKREKRYKLCINNHGYITRFERNLTKYVKFNEKREKEIEEKETIEERCPNIEFIPGFGINCSSQNNKLMELKILYPQDEAMNFLEEEHIYREWFVVSIMNDLKNKNRPINPDWLQERTEKKLFEISISDLSTELFLMYYMLDDLKNDKDAYRKYLSKNIYKYMKRKNYREVIDRMKSEKIYLVNPEKHPGIEREFTGVICSDSSTDSYIEELEKKYPDLELLFGNGFELKDEMFLYV